MGCRSALRHRRDDRRLRSGRRDDLGQFADRFGIDVDELFAYIHRRRSPETIRQFPPAGHDMADITREQEARELTQLDGIVEVPGAGQLLESLNRALENEAMATAENEATQTDGWWISMEDWLWSGGRSRTVFRGVRSREVWGSVGRQ